MIQVHQQSQARCFLRDQQDTASSTIHQATVIPLFVLKFDPTEPSHHTHFHHLSFSQLVYVLIHRTLVL